MKIAAAGLMEQSCGRYNEALQRPKLGFLTTYTKLTEAT